MTFNSLNSEEIYNIVKNSPESWAVEGYDLITSHNAKYFIKLTTNSIGEKTFNLDWPYYGGYEPDTIASIGELSGKIPVSRDGGDGGFTMGYGKMQMGHMLIILKDQFQKVLPRLIQEHLMLIYIRIL